MKWVSLVVCLGWESVTTFCFVGSWERLQRSHWGCCCEVVLGWGSTSGANLGCFILPSPWKKSSAFWVRKGWGSFLCLAIMLRESWKQLTCQSSGVFCVLLAQESESTEFRIVVSVQPLCAAGLPKLRSQAADRPPPAARLPAASATCARMQRAACSARCPTSRICPSFFLLKILPRRKKFAAWMRSRTGRGLGGYTGIFTSSYPDLGSCLSSFSIPGRQPEKKSLSSATGQSCSQRSLCYTRVLFLSDETPLPKPWRTWLWKCQAGSARGEFLLVRSVLTPASSCPTAFLSLLLWRERKQARCGGASS